MGTHSRRKHIKAIWGQGVIVRWIGGIWALYGFGAAFRDEFLPPQEQESYRVVAFMHAILGIPLAWWLVIALVILVSWLFESSFREARQTHGKLAAVVGPTTGLRRFITSPNNVEHAQPDDRYLTVRRAVATEITIYLPPNPAIGKEIEVKLAADDKSSVALIEGNGHLIDGLKNTGIVGAGSLQGYRFSGAEWEIF